MVGKFEVSGDPLLDHVEAGRESPPCDDGGATRNLRSPDP